MCASCAVTPLVRRLLRRAARQTNSALRVPPPSRQRGDLPNIAKMHVAMGLTASPRAIFPCVLLLALVALLAAGVPSPPLPRPGTPLPRHITSLGGLPPANATLDLAAIYVVSLPAARARRRMLADLASLSGLQLTFLDAVGSASMEVNLTREVLGDWVKGRKDYEIATWWSHFRAWQLAADLPSPSRPSFERRRLSELQKGQVERIGLGEPKVLILEDDVDWELDLRSRLPHLLAAAARRRDEYDPAREVEGWDMLSVGWCFEFDTSVPFEQPGYNRVVEEVYVPSGEGSPAARTYHLARPIFPACLHAYILTASSAAHLASTTLPSHVLTLRFPGAYLPPAKQWGPIDIHVSNGPAKHFLHTLVIHPPLFKQVPEGGKRQGEGLLRGAKGEYWRRRGDPEGGERQGKEVEAERGEGMATSTPSALRPEAASWPGFGETADELQRIVASL